MQLKYRLLGEGERRSILSQFRLDFSSSFKETFARKPFEFFDPISCREYEVSWRTKRKFKKMLKVAAKANPTPEQSKFEVKTSAMSDTGRMVKGSNHEHGICEATHGEEAVVSAIIEKAGRNAKVRAIGFAKEEELPKIEPCGNCRDVVKQYGTEDIVLVAGSPKGGKISLVEARKSYFFEDFYPLASSGALKDANLQAIAEARMAEHQASSQYTTQERVYGAAIVCRNGAIFRGSLRGDVSYHTAYPVSEAIATLRNSSKDSNRLDVAELVVVRTGGKPNVPYRDRQHFLEFTEMTAALGRTGPMPVKLYELNARGEAVRGWQTDSKEWLPNPFSVMQLGMEEQLKSAAGKLATLPP